jgi:hypothetical protein
VIRHQQHKIISRKGAKSAKEKLMTDKKTGFVNTVNDASVTKVIDNGKEVQTESLKETKPKEKSKGVTSNVDKT